MVEKIKISIERALMQKMFQDAIFVDINAAANGYIRIPREKTNLDIAWPIPVDYHDWETVFMVPIQLFGWALFVGVTMEGEIIVAGAPKELLLK